MPTKKTAPKKAKKKSAPAGRKRNPEGVTRFWGGNTVKSVKGGSNGKNVSSPRRKRNPAASAEDSAAVRKANELLLRVWENVHAKRDRFGKFD